MKKVWLVGAVSLLGLLVVGVAGVHRWFNPPPPPVQLFTNGTILTMDDRQPQVDAMLVKRGEIVALGDSASLREQVSRDVQVVDLEGGVLMPGFIEAHGHFPGEGLSAVAVDANSPPIGDLDSIETLLERLRTLAKRRPNGTLLAYG
ncbi:MAG: amidohydrolase family protein, partial [Pseudomonadota bacterium]|nr:amidohydrolase family protein [Pseudomonadota bacterium]